MPTKILEAELRISAQDKTAAGLEGVVKRIDGVVKTIDRFRKAQERFGADRGKFAQTQKAVEGAARAMAAVEKPTRAMQAAYKSAQRAVSQASSAFEAQKSVMLGLKHELEGAGVQVTHLAAAQTRLKIASEQATAAQERQRRATARMEKIRSAGGVVAGGIGLAAGHLAWEASRSTVEAVAEGTHERVRMKASGMKPGEIEEAEHASAELSGKFKAISQTKILHLLRNARANVGSYEEAGQIIEPLLKTYTVAMGAHPERKEELDAEFDLLVKGMEIKGITQSMPRFTNAMGMISHALNAFGDTLKPSDFYESIKYGRQASQSLSDEFLLMTVGPTISQEMKGSSAGKAFSTAYQEIIGGAMKQRGVVQMQKLGLLDPKKVIKTKTGATKGFLPGAVVGSELFKTNPYDWVNQVFLPQLAKKGITDPKKIQDLISVIFQASTAAQLMSTFATQQPRIEKDIKLVHGSMGLESADTFMKEDPYIAAKSVTEQFINLLQAAGSPLAESGIAGMKGIADAITALSEAARAHPDAAPAALGGTIAGGLAFGAASTWGLVKGIKYLIRGGVGTSSDVLSRVGAARAAAASSDVLATIGAGEAGGLAAAIPFLAGPAAFLAAMWPVAAGESDADELKRRAAVDGPFAYPSGWPGHGQEIPSAELKGNATLKIDINAPDWLRSAATMSGDIPGVKIGTTGNIGKSMPEAAPRSGRDNE